MPAYTQSTLCGVSPTTTICPKLTAVGKTKGFSRLQVPKPRKWIDHMHPVLRRWVHSMLQVPEKQNWTFHDFERDFAPNPKSEESHTPLCAVVCQRAHGTVMASLLPHAEMSKWRPGDRDYTAPYGDNIPIGCAQIHEQITLSKDR